MRVRFAAVAACFALFVALPAAAVEPVSPLTLDDAFARVADTHPDLRLLDVRTDVLAAERDGAALRPPLKLGATIENAFGNGEARALSSAEITLTLAGVLERGGKLDARRVLAQSRIDALAVEREGKRLDLLAEVARRYLDAVAARQQRRIAQLDVAQRQRTVAAAKSRLQAGASPESVMLAAQAAMAQAELDDARAMQQYDSARQALAALWGERDPEFEVAPADALELPAIGDLADLSKLLEKSPEIARFADAQRIGEARLQLARSNARGDWEWQFGVRRLQDIDGDTALVAGIAVPLGSRSRARPEIRAAQSELDAVQIEREASGISLYATLTQAHGEYRVAQAEVKGLNDDVLPQLARAEAASERVYRAGATSYLEWAQLQNARIDALRRQLDAALQAQRALIEIQRLTGQSFVVAANIEQGTTP